MSMAYSPVLTPATGSLPASAAGHRAFFSMLAFAEFLNHLSIKRRNIGRFSAGHQPVVHHHFAVNPICSSVTQIRPDRWITRHRPAPRHIRFHQHPGPMTYRRHWLALLEKGGPKSHRPLIHPQLV